MCPVSVRMDLEFPEFFFIEVYFIIDVIIIEIHHSNSYQT